jgi:type IV pilus assembly protein PilQ
VSAPRLYAGEKISVDFQNVGVRAALHILADASGQNIVASDSVAGNLTLRLRDLPWDQALDVLLQAKGLDMRRNGNVLWIAPQEEILAAKNWNWNSARRSRNWNRCNRPSSSSITRKRKRSARYSASMRRGRSRLLSRAAAC